MPIACALPRIRVLQLLRHDKQAYTGALVSLHRLPDEKLLHSRGFVEERWRSAQYPSITSQIGDTDRRSAMHSMRGVRVEGDRGAAGESADGRSGPGHTAVAHSDVPR